jgi:ribosomal protein S6--L-glutamate ligase
MILSFHPCIDADVQVILGDRDLDDDQRDLIKHAKAIILPQSCTFDLFTACSSSKAFVFPNYTYRFKYPGKIGQKALFERLNYPHPETLSWRSVSEYEAALTKSGFHAQGFPLVLKADRSHEGEGVIFVGDQTSLKKALADMKRQEGTGQSGFVTQNFVASAGNALRSVIIGSRIFSYWKRPATDEALITTISKGARIDHCWRPELQQKARAMTQQFSLETGINLAALDFVFDLSKKSPEPLFLEINYYFARRGLGGNERYYPLVYQAIRDWLFFCGLAPDSVKLV